MTVSLSWSGLNFWVVSTLLHFNEAHVVLIETHATLFCMVLWAAALPKYLLAILDPDLTPLSFTKRAMLSDHLVILVFRINLNAPLHYGTWLNPTLQINKFENSHIFFKL